MTRRRRDLPEPWEIERGVALLAAMAHPVRFAVLIALGRAGSLSVGELQERTGSEQSAMSHQLRVLRDARLVTAARDGKHVRYSLLDDHVRHVAEDALAHALELPSARP